MHDRIFLLAIFAQVLLKLKNMKRSSSEITIDWNDEDAMNQEHNRQIDLQIEKLEKHVLRNLIWKKIKHLCVQVIISLFQMLVMLS